MIETQYGFKWGPAEVTRLSEVDGRRVLQVKTARHDLEIHVSPAGNSVRVWLNETELRETT